MSLIRLLQVTGPAPLAGTVLGTQSPVEGAAWAEVTGLGTIPAGGALLEVTATGGVACRVAIVPSVANSPPGDGGRIVLPGAVLRDAVPAGARVFTRQL